MVVDFDQAVDALKLGRSATLEIWATVGADCTGEITNAAWISSHLPDPAPADPFLPDPFLREWPTLENNHAAATFTVSSASGRALDGTTIALGRIYPNPFNPQTTIRFGLPESAQVTLVVYDVLGRQVRVLVDGRRAAGTHEVVFEASDLPSGTYLMRLETPQGSFVQTMQLMK